MIGSKSQTSLRGQPGRARGMPKEKGEYDSDHVIIIENDQSQCSDVDVIDVPESSHRRCRSNKKVSKRNFICIDDEDSCGDLDSDATSSKKFCTNRNIPLHTEVSDSEDCQICETKSGFKLSKVRKYPEKVLKRNRFGLSSQTEDELSESDNSDCEVMEDTSGKIRQQWEKAASRKKSLEDQASASGPSPSSRNPKHDTWSSYFGGESSRAFVYSEASVQSSSSEGVDEQSDFPTHWRDPVSRPVDNSQKKDQNFSPCHDRDCFPDKIDPVLKAPSTLGAEQGHEAQVDHDLSSFKDRGRPEMQETSSIQEGETNRQRQSKNSFGQPSPEREPVSTEMDQGEVYVGRDDCGGESSVNNERNMEMDIDDNKKIEVRKHSQPGDETLEDGPNQDILISERERHKQTDEYKRADCEEWAARQRELQSQAEEAKQLRKRKRAETLRLLDVERRQKQRVEEIRNTQKKDEETSNLKEQLRIEVRKELEKLELKYRDMASLLQALGISVGRGPVPMTAEVRAAYKQALLRFHPDRSSKSDIRGQVEAEEIFKLISLLKDKLPATV